VNPEGALAPSGEKTVGFLSVFLRRVWILTMLKYVIKRIIVMPFVLLASTFIIFILINANQADPALIILGTNATQEQINDLHEELGLNDPFLVRFVNYVGDLLHGDMGTSYYTKRSVGEEILVRLPRTLLLSFGGIALAIIIGVPLGIVCAVKQYSVADNVLSALAMLIATTPAFLLSILLLLVFSMRLGWFPASGISAGAKSWVLPIVTVSVPYIGYYLRYTRSSMLDVIYQDYITIARSKGASEKSVIFSHALKNSVISLITITGLYVSFVMAAAVIVETVFSISGVGLYLITAIQRKDIPAVMGGTLTLSIIFLVITLIMDVLNAYADPRIKAKYMTKRAGGKAFEEADGGESA